MGNSIHKRDIMDIRLGEKISLFQQKILESYNLDPKVFALKLKDTDRGVEHVFDKWFSANKEESVYEYMKNKNFDMTALEKSYHQSRIAHKIYDRKKEVSGI